MPYPPTSGEPGQRNHQLILGIRFAETKTMAGAQIKENSKILHGRMQNMVASLTYPGDRYMRLSCGLVTMWSVRPHSDKMNKANIFTYLHASHEEFKIAIIHISVIVMK
jgi:hypothetical protein